MIKYFICLISLLVSLQAQKITIKGKITDSKSGNALAFTNISVENSTIGTTSNEKGFYSLKLDSAEYSLLFSYMGFRTKRVVINKYTNLDIQLEPVEINLPQIEVYAADEGLTFEERFIRNVLRAREKNNEDLSFYITDTYSKTKYYTYVEKEYKLIALIEAISQIGYEKPDNYVEKVLNKNMPYLFKNMPYELISVNQSINLFSDYIHINRLAIKSPLTDDYRDDYDFKALNYNLLDKDTVICIKFSPKKTTSNYFFGELKFNTKNYALLDADLYGAENVKDEMTDSIQIHQKYAFRSDKYNVPVFTRYQYSIDYLSFKIRYTQEYTHVNYDFNNPVNRPVIIHGKKLREELTREIEFDNARMELFQIPLTEEEQEYNKFIEEAVTNAPTYKKILFFIMTDGVGLFADQPVEIAGIKINRFSNWFKFNKVQGPFLGFELNKELFNDVKGYLRTGYGFDDKKLESEIKIAFRNWNLSYADIITNLGDFDYSKMMITYNSLVNHKDNIHYYNKKSIVGSYQFSPVKKIFTELSAGYEKQLPVVNKSEFSLFAKDKKYDPNFAITQRKRTIAGIKISYLENNNYFFGEPIYYSGESFINFSTDFKYYNGDAAGKSEKSLVIESEFYSKLHLYNPGELNIRALYHKNTNPGADQDYMFINNYNIMGEKVSPLSFYSFDNYEYALKDFIKFNIGMDILKLPEVFKRQLTIGLTLNYLHPFEYSKSTYFKNLTEDIYEFGVYLKGYSFINIGILKNNLSRKWNVYFSLYYQ